MKKFLVVLLSLGLIMAFSMPASAQMSVKFGGSFIVEGAYENNINQSGSDNKGFFGGHTSASAIWTRTRIWPTFQIAEGLSLYTRFDALEKQWGNVVWRYGGTDDYTNSRRMPGTTTTSNAKIQENIEFERAFVTFKTAIGQFEAGYMAADLWGTGFNDWEQTRPRIRYTLPMGAFTMLAVYDKVMEGDMVGPLSARSGKVDLDSDSIALAGVYADGPVQAGLLYKYYLYNAGRALPVDPFKMKISQLSPFIKATFGPLFIESELVYFYGDWKAYENETATTKNVTMNAFGGYLKARYTMGPAYFGGVYFYTSGDDLQDVTEKKNQVMAKGVNTTLILMGDDYLTDIFPGGNAYDAGNFASPKNAQAGISWYNIHGGFNVTPKLNIESNFTYATFNETPRVGNTKTGKEYVSKQAGMEIDLQASYKIYDNLTYMVAAGYLFTGDAFKGSNPNASTDDDYVLMNRLVLNF